MPPLGLRSTPSTPALHPKEAFRICGEPVTPTPIYSPLPRALRNQVAALSYVYLFPCFVLGFFFFPFQETIIIQIIAVIYSAIRVARCSGRRAETDEHRQGG